MSGSRTLLAFDYGHKKIGVAVGQEITRSTRPLLTLASREGRPDWEAIAALLRQWRPSALVVGLPLQLNGEEQDTTLAARRFANRLRGRYHLPVYFADERMTSMAAQQRIREHRAAGGGQSPGVDAVAAQLILETFFSEGGRCAESGDCER